MLVTNAQGMFYGTKHTHTHTHTSHIKKQKKQNQTIKVKTAQEGKRESIFCSRLLFKVFICIFLLPALLDEVGFNFMRKGIAAIEARGEYAGNIIWFPLICLKADLVC